MSNTYADLFTLIMESDKITHLSGVGVSVPWISWIDFEQTNPMLKEDLDMIADLPEADPNVFYRIYTQDKFLTPGGRKERGTIYLLVRVFDIDPLASYKGDCLVNV